MRKTIKLTDAIREAVFDAKQRGLLRSMLAREAGISEGNLSDFLHHKMGLDVRKLDKLAAALGITISVDHAAQRRTVARFEKAKKVAKRG